MSDSDQPDTPYDGNKNYLSLNATHNQLNLKSEENVELMKYFFIIVLVIVFIVGVSANVVNLIILIRGKLFRKSAKYFHLITSSVSNLIFLLLTILFIGSQVITNYWQFDLCMCKITEFLLNYYLAVSAILLVIIAYYLFMNEENFAEKSKVNQEEKVRNINRIVAISVFFAAVIISLPVIYFASMFAANGSKSSDSGSYGDNNRENNYETSDSNYEQICFLWNDGETFLHYTIIAFIVQYILPVLLVILILINRFISRGKVMRKEKFGREYFLALFPIFIILMISEYAWRLRSINKLDFDYGNASLKKISLLLVYVYTWFPTITLYVISDNYRFLFKKYIVYCGKKSGFYKIDQRVSCSDVIATNGSDLGNIDNIANTNSNTAQNINTDDINNNSNHK